MATAGGEPQERYTFVAPALVDEFMLHIASGGVLTDTGFRVDAPNGNILLHLLGDPAVILSAPGHVFSTDRLA